MTPCYYDSNSPPSSIGVLWLVVTQYTQQKNFLLPVSDTTWGMFALLKGLKNKMDLSFHMLNWMLNTLCSRNCFVFHHIGSEYIKHPQSLLGTTQKFKLGLIQIWFMLLLKLPTIILVWIKLFIEELVIPLKSESRSLKG